MQLFRRIMFLFCLVAAGGYFIYGCSKQSAWTGIGFSLHRLDQLSSTTLMLIGIFFVGLANLLRR
jgi:hypothetical protein